MIQIPEDGWGAGTPDLPGTLLGSAALAEPSFAMPDWLDGRDEPAGDADSARKRAVGIFRRQRGIGAFNRELDTVVASIAEAPDGSGGLERFDRKVEELRQRHAGGLSDAEDRDAFARHTGEFAAMQRIGLERALFERQASDALSQLDDQLAYYAGKAVGADNEVFRQIALDSGLRSIDELRDAGYLTEDGAEARKAAFLNPPADDVESVPVDLEGLIRLAGNLLDSGINTPEAIDLKDFLQRLLRRGGLPKRPRRKGDEPQGSPTSIPPRLPKPPVAPSPETKSKPPPEAKPRWKPLAPQHERYTGEGPDGLVRFQDGNTEFGRLDAEAASVARAHGVTKAEEGPIILERGFHDSRAGRGMGAEHIEARHGKDIRAYKDEQGKQLYGDSAELVADVAANYNRIARGHHGRIILGMTNGKDKIAVVEMAQKGDRYTVITAGIYRKGWLDNPSRALPWRRTGPSSSPASGLPASTGGIATDTGATPRDPGGQGL